MARFGAILSYDGTAYQGFQRQPEPTPTIQAEVECAIAAIARRAVRVTAAGRTDAGVHATGQVIAFDVSWKHTDQELLRAINSQLPRDIALQRVWRQAGFHPRFDARWRQYRYQIATVCARHPLLSRFVWQRIGESMDDASMREAAAICLGEHDFAAFGAAPQPESNNTVRQVFISRWETRKEEFGTRYTYRIRGTAFLYHMVRRLVGTMVQVGEGKLTIRDFREIMLSKDLEQAKVLAPPQGLVLEEVGYPEPAAAKSSERAAQTVTVEAALEESS